MSLSKPLKILCAGAVLAALVAGGGGVMNAVDRASGPTVAAAQARIQALMAECEAESSRKQATGKARAAAGEHVAPWDLLLAICEPPAEAQIALEDARRREAGLDAALWPYVVAAAIVVFSAVPWLWYFLLRRLVELRQAVLGREPPLR